MIEILEFFKPLNWETVLGMFIISWYFTREIKLAVNKLDMDVKEQSKRTDRLYEMFIDLLKEKR